MTPGPFTFVALSLAYALMPALPKPWRDFGFPFFRAYFVSMDLPTGLRYELRAFRRHLLACGMANSTAAQYASVVRMLLQEAKSCCAEDVAAYAAATNNTSSVAAWNYFARFARGK